MPDPSVTDGETSSIGPAGPTAEADSEFIPMAKGVLLVIPEGPLTCKDIDSLKSKLNALRARALRPSIVIHTRAFPGWKSTRAFFEQVRFIRDHHREIAKVAIASSSSFFRIARPILAPLVSPEIRLFVYEALADAVAWAEEK